MVKIIGLATRALCFRLEKIILKSLGKSTQLSIRVVWLNQNRLIRRERLTYFDLTTIVDLVDKQTGLPLNFDERNSLLSTVNMEFFESTRLEWLELLGEEVIYGERIRSTDSIKKVSETKENTYWVSSIFILFVLLILGVIFYFSSLGDILLENFG